MANKRIWKYIAIRDFIEGQRPNDLSFVHDHIVDRLTSASLDVANYDVLYAALEYAYNRLGNSYYSSGNEFINLSSSICHITVNDDTSRSGTTSILVRNFCEDKPSINIYRNDGTKTLKELYPAVADLIGKYFLGNYDNLRRGVGSEGVRKAKEAKANLRFR